MRPGQGRLPRAVRAAARALPATWTPWWAQRPPRERRLLVAAAVVVVGAAFWSVAIAPAWRVLGTAPAELRQSSARLQQMRSLAVEARALQAAAAVSPERARQALEQASDRYFADAGRIEFNHDQATLRIEHATPQALAAWLEQARLAAHALPLSAHLTRLGDGADAPWQGTLVVALPAASGEVP